MEPTTVPPVVGSMSSVPAPVKMGKFAASLAIIKQSWNILVQDKELALFPVASFVTSLVALILMCVVYFFAALGGNIHSVDSPAAAAGGFVSYAILFIYYAVTFFIVNFFLAGMYIIIHARFNGQNLSFTDGVKGALNCVTKILLWSCISATVGVVLNIIASKGKIVGQIVSALLGAAWNILTYFSLPALVIGQTSVRDSFKESAGIIRKTWGESIIVNFGVGLVFGLIFMLAFVAAIVTVILVPTLSVAILVAILFIIFLVVMSILSSTLGSIFKLALYEYGRTGIVPQGFTPALVQNAIKNTQK